MTRIHSHRRGKSQSFRPINKNLDWVEVTSAQISEIISKLNKEGLNSSQIGVVLRDQYTVPSVRAVVGKKMKEILEDIDASPTIPEDLDSLVKRAVRLQNHLKTNKGDRKNVRSLELLEAKIHRVSKYYKTRNIIPKDWKYKAMVAQLT
jgi:small subunit ribosomal protein S15|tara:strand:- start:357 stop:803 length:447 start_codon:yes stop_codon:yes gene_type:complete